MRFHLTPKHQFYGVIILGCVLLATMGWLQKIKDAAPVKPPKAASCPQPLKDQLETTAKIFPHVENALLRGWVIKDIALGSPWSKFGLRDGDVIMTISDEEAHSPAEFTAAMNEFCLPGFKMNLFRPGTSAEIELKQTRQAEEYLKP